MLLFLKLFKWDISTSIPLYTFIPVLMTLIEFQGHSGVRKVKLKVVFLANQVQTLHHSYIMDMIMNIIIY